MRAHPIGARIGRWEDDRSRCGRYFRIMSESVLPATTSLRIAEVDILRGFALFGILIVNVAVATLLWSFGGTADDPRLGFDGPFDHLVNAVVEALFSGRFYLLFAFLFGYSFTLQIAAAQRAGVSANPRLLRRCATLMVIGLAHVLLLWIGDILTLYAFLCLFLILLRWLRPRVAVIGGTVLYLTWSIWAFLPGTGGIAELAEVLDVVAMHEGYTGSFADTFTMQVSGAPLWIILIWITQGVPALGMFLIGMAAGKRKLFTEEQTLRRWAPRIFIGGLAGRTAGIGGDILLRDGLAGTAVVLGRDPRSGQPADDVRVHRGDHHADPINPHRTVYGAARPCGSDGGLQLHHAVGGVDGDLHRLRVRPGL